MGENMTVTALWLIGIVLILIMPQFRQRKHILFTNGLFCVVMAFYSHLNNAQAATMMNIIMSGWIFICLHPLVAEWMKNRAIKFTAMGCVVVYAFIFIYSNLIDIFPVIAFLAGRSAEMLTVEQRIRQMYVISQSSWLIYGLTFSLWLPVTSGTIFLGSTLIALYRYAKPETRAMLAQPLHRLGIAMPPTT